METLPATPFPLSKCLTPPRSLHHISHVFFHLPPASYKSAVVCIQASLSDSRPPTSKEEAVLQAKTSLSTTLQKPLNNPRLVVGRIKKLKQPRFRVEIPLVDDSEDSLTQLAFDVLGNIGMKRKTSPILMLWPNAALSESATRFFHSLSATQVEHIDITSVDHIDDARLLNSGDVAVFVAPDASQIATLKTLTDALYPKPVVLFNPTWAFEDEINLGELSSFVCSFEVVYSFLGLEVRGILSKRKGMVYKCVRDGVVSSENWIVFVEEENGDWKCVSNFKTRPSMVEVETVLYNLMAVNSPVTKAAKFIRDLVSNVTGRKK